MKKIYSFLMACVLGASALTATAERVVTAMTDRGPQLTSVDQLSQGKKVLFRATSRDGYLFENENKLWLSRGVPSSGTSSYYLFTVDTFEKSGEQAIITLKTPQNFFIPTLVSGSSPTINAESTAMQFTLTRANTQGAAVGDTIWYIQDLNGMYFNGNQLVSNSALFGTYGTFAGWNEAGGNSQYQIFLPEVKEETLYTVTVDGVNTTADALYNTRTYEVGMGDSIALPAVAGYHIKFDETTYNGEPIAPGSYFKVTGDGAVTITYELNDLLFTPISNTDTTWYFLKIRDNYYCYYNPETNAGTTEGAVPTSATADNEHPDAYLWAFAGDRENGFRLINKKAGNSLVLTAVDVIDGAANYLAAADGDPALNTYMYGEPVNGKFYLQIKGTESGVENAYINQYGGAQNGKLRFYVAGDSKMDGGSHFKVVKYDADSVARVVRKATLAKYQEVVNAAGAVGGYTPEETADLKEAVEVTRTALATYAYADTTAAYNAYTALLAKTKIAFDPTKTYILKSAFDRSAHKDSTFGIFFKEGISEGDSLNRLKWGAIPAGVETNTGDPAFKFKFVAVGENASKVEPHETDSAYYYLTQTVGDKTYTMGHWAWGGTASMLTPEDAANATNNTGNTGIYNAKTIIQPGAYFGTHSFAHIFSYINGSGATAWDKVTVSTNQGNGNAAAVSGNIRTYNIVSKAVDTSWYLIPVEETVTAISAVEATKAAQAGTIYDLTGRKVSKAQKGLYIINGQKTVVK
ncbi:MAG: hypothetical protein SOY99_04655 [Alloprevotella sp.]|nr:hypothetical protein [Bacteroidales bacterium]MDY3943501.1 hypothetical protein [Alloprevotella sp.]